MYEIKARNRVAEGVIGAVQRELNKNKKIVTLNSSLMKTESDFEYDDQEKDES